jgi:flagellar motor switch/type III secretory pathway protein FliN
VTSSVREWLPLEIVGHTAVRAALADAVEAWSDHWFRRHRLTVGSIVAATAGSAARDGGWSWKRFGEAVAINLSANSPTPFAAWLLDGEGDPLLTSAADRVILDDLETTMLADLATRIEQNLGMAGAMQDGVAEIADPLGEDGGAVVGLKEASGAAVLRLAIPRPVMAGFVKTKAPRRRPAAHRPDPRVEALRATEVRLEACLGAAELSLADLQNLAPGDVLVLDTRLDGLAALTVEGGVSPLAAARVANTDGRLSLTLQA